MISADRQSLRARAWVWLALGAVALAGARPARGLVDPAEEAGAVLSSERDATRPTWSVGGVVSAFFSSRIDYVGVVRIDGRVPTAAGAWRLGLETTVPVRSVSGSGTMIVDDLDYRAEVSLERGRGSLFWAPFAAARGSQEMDEEGSLGVVLAGFRIGREAPQKRFDWELEGAGVVGEWGLGARAAYRASGEWRAWRRQRWESGLTGAVDGLWLDSAEEEFENDLTIGPFMRLRRPGGLRLSFHALYYRGENPLGLEDTGVLAGVQFEDGPAHGRSGSLPRLRAALAAGGGEDGVRARQLLDVTSSAFPLLGASWRARLLADNTLLDARLNDIYYVIVGGIERAGGRVLPGLAFYHRSGHLLDQPNDRRLSINVLEAGLRTAGWQVDLPAWPDAGRLTGEIWAGGVLTSEFGEHQRWNARAALLWVLPGHWTRAAPFAGGRVHKGEVETWAAQGGWVTPNGWSLSVLAERDAQRLEARDTSVTLLLARRF